MTLDEMIRRNKTTVASLFSLLVILYLFISAFSNIQLSDLSFLRQKKPLNTCPDTQFVWRGANDRIYPASGRPVFIKHIDYSQGIANHDVSIMFARSYDEEFSIKTDISTSHEVPADNFEISYNSQDELTINTLVPKNSGILADEATRNLGHCIRINIELLIPVSKPLSGLRFELPQANLFFHNSTWGSLPYLEVDIGEGNLHFSSAQRLHIETTTLKVDEGSIVGKLMLTKQLTVELRSGTIDLDVGFSPYLVGANIDVAQFSGVQKLRLEDKFYRTTTSKFSLSSGAATLSFPKSFQGLVSVDSKSGSIDVSGPSLNVVERSGEGVKPVWVEAMQGFDRHRRLGVRAGHADIKLFIDGPENAPRPPLVEMEGLHEEEE